MPYKNESGYKGKDAIAGMPHRADAPAKTAVGKFLKSSPGDPGMHPRRKRRGG